jgi:ATP:ADP antiporter, AAA family
MHLRLKSILRFFLDVEPHERLKVILLTLSFFFIIGGYTIVKELKDSLFVHIVGKEYIPWAKIVAMGILIPPILLYSRLVDLMRRYHLLYVYTIVYGVGGLIITYFLADSSIGLGNVVTSKYRYFGWFVYFFLEGYSPFVVGLFWAFANSITSPQAAKSNYPLMIAGSKIGGACMSALALLVLGRNGDQLLFPTIFAHQILFALASLLLLLVPFVIHLLITMVPGRYLHGYEAAYRVEKARDNEVKEKMGLSNFMQSMLGGLTMLLRYPYLMGMFGMVFFWEMVNVVFGYERLGVGQATSLTMSDYSHFLFESALFVHIAGFAIVLFGTRALMSVLGERRSLMLVPALTGVLLIYYLSFQSATAVLIVYVLIRSINYAFAYPLRESLYIPTTKEMKFKSKSWIDAFGIKIAKSSASYYNLFVEGLHRSLLTAVNGVFFVFIIGSWLITAHLLGRRFEIAVKNNEVIGAEEH